MPFPTKTNFGFFIKAPSCSGFAIKAATVLHAECKTGANSVSAPLHHQEQKPHCIHARHASLSGNALS
jgi:hypothetical protein